jgi:2-methylcitrate dehydratase
MTQVEALAKYAARASFADLSAQSRQQLPVHILDSLGCCIAALGAGPVEACRTQVADFGGDGPCALIGGGNANPIFAAFWHTALVRYVDFMDNFLAPTETCHTADNFGVALTIAEYVGGSGRDLMLASRRSRTPSPWQQLVMLPSPSYERSRYRSGKVSPPRNRRLAR